MSKYSIFVLSFKWR